MLASIEDHMVQGQRQAVGEAPSPNYVLEREQRRKNPPQHLKFCDYESPSSPNNNQRGTRTNKQKETWTPKPVKCCWSIWSTSPDRVSLLAAAAPSTVAAGTGQWLELLGGLGLLSRRWQADALGQPRLHTLLPLSVLGTGVTVWSRGWSVFPTVVPWLTSPGDSNEKGRKKGQKRERKSSLGQRPKQRRASALHCLSFSVVNRNEREACVLSHFKGILASSASMNLGQDLSGSASDPTGLKGRVKISGRGG